MSAPERSPATAVEPGAGRLRLADLLGGLSTAADLGFGLPPEEAMRTCLVATALARDLGLAEGDVADTFWTALLTHVGCSALSHETAAAWGDDRVLMAAVASTNVADPVDIAARVLPAVGAGRNAADRARLERYAAEHGAEFGRRFDTGSCEVASATARRVGLGPGVERALREEVEWWNGEGPPRGLAGEAIALPARLARAAGDAVRFDQIGGPDAAVAALRARAGVILDPRIVEHFVPRAGTLLAEADRGDPRDRILEVEPLPVAEVDAGDGLAAVAAAFGDLSDLKTPFTHGHAAAVAQLAGAAARLARLDRQTASRLETAAALADLGRLAVSNAVWEKPGPLTRAEHEMVRMHPYHSERILATSAALEPMARLAGMHHERMDGSGYHRGCRARDLPAAVRLLGAADAFCAMTRSRPHRAALPAERAADELQADVRRGRLDGDAVAAVLEAAGRGRPGAARACGPPGSASARSRSCGSWPPGARTPRSRSAW